MTLSADVDLILQGIGVQRDRYRRGERVVRSPLTGETIAQVEDANPDSVTDAIGRSEKAFLAWRSLPAPRRGEFVRILGEELRASKADLGRLVTIETGKILSEGHGEVQEMIDICDFAVGLSRQLYGLTIASERPHHRMMEQWHPLGPVGIITAFNFPVAVWSWNAALALVCGNPVIWKPSEKTPLTALAVDALVRRAGERFDGIPEGLSTVLIGGREIGEMLVDDPRVPLVSATGSTAMGQIVGPATGPALCASHPGVGWQQRFDSVSVGRSRPRASRDCLRCRWYRRPALHVVAPAVRTSQRHMILSSRD